MIYEEDAEYRLTVITGEKQLVQMDFEQVSYADSSQLDWVILRRGLSVWTVTAKELDKLLSC